MQKIWNNGDVCDWGDGPRLTVQGLMNLGHPKSRKAFQKNVKNVRKQRGRVKSGKL